MKHVGDLENQQKRLHHQHVGYVRRDALIMTNISLFAGFTSKDETERINGVDYVDVWITPIGHLYATVKNPESTRFCYKYTYAPAKQEEKPNTFMPLLRWYARLDGQHISEKAVRNFLKRHYGIK